MNAVGVHFNTTVLKALDNTTPKDGNAIQATIRKTRGSMLAPGVLRPTLNTLIQEGLAMSPARNTYIITDAGIEWLQNQVL